MRAVVAIKKYLDFGFVVVVQNRFDKIRYRVAAKVRRDITIPEPLFSISSIGMFRPIRLERGFKFLSKMQMLSKYFRWCQGRNILHGKQ